MTTDALTLNDLVAGSRFDTAASRPDIRQVPVRTQTGKLSDVLRSGLAMLSFVAGTSTTTSTVAEVAPLINGGRTVRGELFTEPQRAAAADRASDFAAFAIAAHSDRKEVAWVKEHAGLTWDQLGKVFGVSRRAIHLWSNGGRLNEPNARRLREFGALIRRLETDLGPAASPETVRGRLLEVESDGLSLIDRLRRERSSGVAWGAPFGPEHLVGAIREPLPGQAVAK